MMNEATDVHHVAVVFRLCLNEEKMFPRCGTRSFTSPGVHWGLGQGYERKTSFRLRAFFDLVFVSQLCDANGSTTLHPSWLKMHQ